MNTLRQNAFVVVILSTALATMLAGTAGAVVLAQHRHTAPPAGRINAIARRPSLHATPTARPTPTAIPVPLPPGNDWTQYRYGVDDTGVNPENSITSADAAQLTTRWVTTEVSGYHPFESTPAELDGVVYITAGNSLHALDFHTGVELWHFDDVQDGPQPGTINSSVAIDPSTRIAYYGTPRATVYAVSTVTHQMVWNVQLGDPDNGAYIWSSPLLVNGKVYIGLASRQDDPCVRGAIFALDAASGVAAWTHYTIPAGSLGGGVWSSLAADPDTHQVIATTGNPCDGAAVIGEDDSIIGLDWDTGNTVWQFQAIAYDDCDCDFGQGPVVFTYQGTKYIVAGSKLGEVYAIVPPAGGGTPQLVWSAQVAAPGSLGQGGVFEPPTYLDGMVFVAGGPTPDGACAKGALWAFRVDSGAQVWRQCTSGQVVGASALTGDVLFVPQQDVIVAYAATTGNVVWQQSQPGPTWGGVSIARGVVLSATVAGDIYAYGLPSASG
jgi:PQQ-like domain